MDIVSMLEIISVQRHDFLNHLQVISGLLQLNKADRVKDYIRHVSLEVERLSKVVHLKVPQAAAAFLLGHHQAEKHQVEVYYNIQTDLGDCAVPGEQLGRVLFEALKQSLWCMASPEINRRRVDINLLESERKYTCRILFPEPPNTAADSAQAALAEAEKQLAPFGGRVGLAVSGNGGEIYITFPRNLPETAQLGT